ncbi:MAG: hypothetical protein NVS3B5_17730 [Sphingomicrobium sp.]
MESINMVTPELLRALGVQATPEIWAPAIDKACAAHGINTPRRLAAFLGNVLHETGNLSCTIENLNYTPQRLCEIWPAHFADDNAHRYGRTDTRSADQHMIAELAYGGRMGNGPPGCGDGWKFRGHGLPMLTGRENYARFGQMIGVSADDLPALMEKPDTSAEVAALFFEKSGCNELADDDDLTAIRERWNGGRIGLLAVQMRTQAVMKALAALPATTPASLPAATQEAAPSPSSPHRDTLGDVLVRAILSLFRRS